MAGERLDMEQTIFRRTGALLHLVFRLAWPRDLPQQDVTPSGNNPLYIDPIRFAISSIGFPAENPRLVTDADLIRVVDVDTAYDLAEYRMIANCLGNYVTPDETVGSRSKSMNAMAQRFQSRLSELESLYKHLLKSAVPRIGFGTIRLPIAPHLAPEFSPDCEY